MSIRWYGKGERYDGEMKPAEGVLTMTRQAFSKATRTRGSVEGRSLRR